MSLCNNNFSLYPNGKIPLFPAFIRPQPSELFSSWVVRLAHAHYMKVHTFTAFNFPDKQFWNRDIDRSVTDDLLEELAIRSNCKIQSIYQTTLRSYEGVLFESHTEKTTANWIIPLGVYHRTWKNKALMYCPGCLQNDYSLPYFRKQWRLSLLVVCVTCNCFLRDCCPSCGASIIFFRSELGHKLKEPDGTLGNCYNCRFELAKTEKIPADREIIEIQKKILKTLEHGYSDQIIYPIQFFNVLHHLLKIFTGSRPIYVLVQKKLSENLGLKYTPQKGGYKHRYDTLSIPERTTALRIAFWIIQNWPERFVEFFKPLKFYSSDLLRDFHDIPYWYWSVVYSNLYISNTNRRF